MRFARQITKDLIIHISNMLQHYILTGYMIFSTTSLTRPQRYSPDIKQIIVHVVARLGHSVLTHTHSLNDLLSGCLPYQNNITARIVLSLSLFITT